jgi:methionine synthase I (cobalamin-dependent)
VVNGEDAERDMARDWCFSWCEYATVCRGTDTDVEGLIEDPENIASIERYYELSKQETDAKKAKKELQKTLESIPVGSTGTLNFRRTTINGFHVEYDNPGYTKIDIRPVPKPKAGKK